MLMMLINIGNANDVDSFTSFVISTLQALSQAELGIRLEKALARRAMFSRRLKLAYLFNG